MTDLNTILSAIFVLMVFAAIIIVYELFRALLFALRRKFRPTYHIEVLRAPTMDWRYWEIVQGEGGGDYLFTYKEAKTFKDKEENKPWGDNMRIVQAR